MSIDSQLTLLRMAARTDPHLRQAVAEVDKEIQRLRALDSSTRLRLAGQAQKNRRPPHPEPLRTMGYWRERCAIVEVREAALREVLEATPCKCDVRYDLPRYVPGDPCQRCAALAAHAGVGERASGAVGE